MTLNCIHIFIVTGSFLYWCVMRLASQRFFIHSCIYLRILIISYLATFLGTNSLSVLMCRKAVNQSIKHILPRSSCPFIYFCAGHKHISTNRHPFMLASTFQVAKWSQMFMSHHICNTYNTHLLEWNLLQWNIKLSSLFNIYVHCAVLTCITFVLKSLSPMYFLGVISIIRYSLNWYWSFAYFNLV